ncbi:MAG: serine/threonine protein kinase [Xanthomonadales bacterium]|nr:serine/threonine protein kinase [Xanthomonadales bacterium]
MSAKDVPADLTRVTGDERTRVGSGPAAVGEGAVRIGPYRLLESLGAGGMGQVWLAERADGAYRHRVAIKIMASVLGDPLALARANAERQFLATLEHPGITRVLDGGTTAAGQPYVVMEFVDGHCIDDWCRQRALPLRARIELFQQVLAAVDAAHRALIVHRDLKPSNVMVNREGQVKLLDFGIAKALGQDSDPALVTRGVGPLTPNYASPEQFEGRPLTTACDVWSLGVLLYRLLTGVAPFEVEAVALSAIPALLARGPRLRPSQAAAATALGIHERDLRGWKRQLQGDLDRVLAQAQSVEPARRYGSARAFADDLERWLAHEPVHARGGGAGDRALKFLRRNRLPVAAGVAVFAALVGGLVATRREARIAEHERNNARDVGEVMAHLLSHANPSVAGADSGATTIAAVMDRIRDQLAAGAFDARPEVKVELARIISDNLRWQGRYADASALLGQRIDTIRSRLAEHPTLPLLADADEAATLFDQQRLQESDALFARTVPRLRTAYADGAIEAPALVTALNFWGYLRRTLGDSAAAEAHFREALGRADALAPEEFFHISTTQSVLASTLADQGRFDAALSTAAAAVRAFESVPGRTLMPDYGFALTVHAGFLVEGAELAAADTELTRAEALFRRTLGDAHLWLGDNLRNQALLALALGDIDRAARNADAARAIYERSFGEKYDHYPTVLVAQAEVAAARGAHADAEALFRRALRLREANLPRGHFFTALAQSAFGAWLAHRDPASPEARALLESAYATLRQTQGESNPRTRLARTRLEERGEKRGQNTFPDQPPQR